MLSCKKGAKSVPDQLVSLLDEVHRIWDIAAVEMGFEVKPNLDDWEQVVVMIRSEAEYTRTQLVNRGGRLMHISFVRMSVERAR